MVEGVGESGWVCVDERDEFEAIIAIDRKKKRRVIYEVINFR